MPKYKPNYTALQLKKYMAVTKKLRECKDTEREKIVMKKELSSFEFQLCDIQGRLFELARAEKAGFPEFAEAFMKNL